MRFCTLLITCLIFSNSAIADVTGIARVIDGDTIQIGEIRIELWGYDAPEQQQTCTIKGIPWKCGEAATKHLITSIGNKSVSCVPRGTNSSGQPAFKCAIGYLDVGAELVEVGLAIPYWNNGGEYYIRSFKEAQGLAQGMHAGSFIVPWEWRKRQISFPD